MKRLTSENWIEISLYIGDKGNAEHYCDPSVGLTGNAVFLWLKGRWFDGPHTRPHFNASEMQTPVLKFKCVLLNWKVMKLDSDSWILASAVAHVPGERKPMQSINHWTFPWAAFILFQWCWLLRAQRKLTSCARTADVFVRFIYTLYILESFRLGDASGVQAQWLGSMVSRMPRQPT